MRLRDLSFIWMGLLLTMNSYAVPPASYSPAAQPPQQPSAQPLQQAAPSAPGYGQQLPAQSGYPAPAPTYRQQPPAQPEYPSSAPTYGQPPAQPGNSYPAGPNPYQNAYNFPPDLPVGPPNVDVAQHPEFANLYINKDRHYSIWFPPEWKKTQNQKNFDVMYFAPRNPGNPRTFAYVSVITVDIPHTMGLFDFVDLNVNDLSNRTKGFNIVTSSPTNLGGIVAKAITYNYSDYISAYTVRQFFLVYNSVAYIITCSSSVSAFNQHDPTFNKIVSSFQIFQ